MSQNIRLTGTLAFACVIGLARLGHAQQQIATDEPVQATLVTRTSAGENASMPLVSEELVVTIDGQLARTSLKQVYENRANAQVEGQYRLSAGSAARVEGFAYWNGEQKIVGEVFEKQTARAIYDNVTRRRRDPGLLEQVADGVFAFKIFPIQPGEKKRVQIEYTAWLGRRGRGVRYRAPVHHEGAVISVTIENAGTLAQVRSPTHEIHVDKLRSGGVRVQATRAKGELGVFELVYQVEEKPFTPRVFIHRDAGQDAYFAVALAAPDMPESAIAAKDVTLVLDRSGSMAGEPLAQAKAAAANVVRRLGAQDRINVISFDDDVYPLFESPRPADREARERALDFINRLTDGGGTDLARALEVAFQSQEKSPRPRVVLFLTDGQSESRSTLAAAQADGNDVRVFTVGMGQGVNRPLLSRLAATKRGRFTYIAGTDAIERDVGTLYRQISRPLLIDVALDTRGARAQAIYPRTLPDLFLEDELVITGRLVGKGPVSFTVRGSLDGKNVSYQVEADLPDAVARPWVGKLWAQSRVDHLIEEIGLTGPNQELENEVIELALAYNFVTQYTSFLAIPESELTAEARDMMLSARERKRQVMIKKADAAALGAAERNKDTGVVAVRRPPPPSPTSSSAAQPGSVDFESDDIDGELAAPEDAMGGDMVDTRNFATHAGSTRAADEPAEAEEQVSYSVVREKGGGCAGCASGGAASGGLPFLLAFLALIALRCRRRGA